MTQNKDFIKKLGVMALGSRLKRLNDRLNKSVSIIYRDLDVDFEPGWFTMINMLNDNSPISITELAAELDLTHPGIIKISNELAKKGLVKSHKDKNDERRRLLALTPKGKKLVKKLQPTWNNIATVANQLLDSADYDLLKLIDQIESELDNKEFHKRYYSFTGG